MNKTTKKHFVFDVDDTLTDSYEFNQQMFVDTFAPYLKLTNPETDKYLRDLHYQSRGASMLSQFEEATKHYSLNVNATDLMKANEQLHINNVDQIKVFEAVIEVIKVLKAQGREISVCTNRQIQSLTRIFKNHDLLNYFTNIISCTDAGHEKPDPHCLLELIAKSGRPKEEFIYFGDSRTDHQFAVNSGIDFIIIDHYLNKKLFYKMIVQSFL